jgi:uncharacterized membrane protein YcfT
MKPNIGECSRNAQFIWADKAALFAALAFLSLLAFFWLLAFLVVGSLGANHLWRHIGIQGVELGLLVAGSAWVVMRGADFIASGSIYRHFAERSVEVIAAELISVRDKRTIIGRAEVPAYHTAAIEPLVVHS